jgi:hypothetical protein
MILSIDPSSTCVAWAILEMDGTVIHWNARAAKSHTVQKRRIRELPEDTVTGAIEMMDDDIHKNCHTPPKYVVVELPQDKGWGGPRQRSSTHLPTYGRAVGIIEGVWWERARSLPSQPKLYRVSASDWVKNFPKGDDNKTNRIRIVERLLGIELGEHAKDTCDAVLLGRWASDRIRLAEMAGAV